MAKRRRVFTKENLAVEDAFIEVDEPGEIGGEDRHVIDAADKDT